MTLETIKTRLSSEGYTVFFVRQTLRITKGGQTSGDFLAGLVKPHGLRVRLLSITSNYRAV